SKKRLGAAHFLAEIFKRMRQRMADGKAQCSQTKRVQENSHLMTDSHGAVLQIAIIKSQTWVQKNLLHAAVSRDVDLPGKRIAHRSNRIISEMKLAHFPDVGALHITKNNGGVMRCDQAKDFFGSLASGQIHDVPPCFEASLSNSR